MTPSILGAQKLIFYSPKIWQVRIWTRSTAFVFASKLFDQIGAVVSASDYSSGTNGTLIPHHPCSLAFWASSAVGFLCPDQLNFI